jgi:hypothetical protein
MAETTSFGAALAAGKAFGLWDLRDPKSIPIINESFLPSISEECNFLIFFFFLNSNLFSFLSAKRALL